MFSKTGREDKAKRDPELLYLKPNYEFIKKRPPSAVLLGPKPTTTSDRYQKVKEEEPQAHQAPQTKQSPSKSPRKPVKAIEPNLDLSYSPQKPAGYIDRTLPDDTRSSVSTDISEFEDFFKAKMRWEKQVDVWAQDNPKLVQISTADISSLSRKSTEPEVETQSKIKSIGPGAYEVSYKSIERTPKGGKFGSSPRVKEPEKKLELLLNPSIDFTKWNHPKYGIYKEQPKNDKLKLKEEQIAQQAEKAAESQLMTPVDVTEALKLKVPGGLIAPPTLDILPPHKLNNRIGPGKYDISYTAIDPA